MKYLLVVFFITFGIAHNGFAVKPEESNILSGENIKKIPLSVLKVDRYGTVTGVAIFEPVELGENPSQKTIDDFIDQAKEEGFLPLVDGQIQATGLNEFAQVDDGSSVSSHRRRGHHRRHNRYHGHISTVLHKGPHGHRHYRHGFNYYPYNYYTPYYYPYSYNTFAGNWSYYFYWAW